MGDAIKKTVETKVSEMAMQDYFNLYNYTTENVTAEYCNKC